MDLGAAVKCLCGSLGMEPSGVWAESDSLGITLLSSVASCSTPNTESWDTAQNPRRGALCAVLQQNPEALDRPRLLVQAVLLKGVFMMVIMSGQQSSTLVTMMIVITDNYLVVWMLAWCRGLLSFLF